MSALLQILFVKHGYDVNFFMSFLEYIINDMYIKYTSEVATC